MALEALTDRAYMARDSSEPRVPRGVVARDSQHGVMMKSVKTFLFALALLAPVATIAQAPAAPTTTVAPEATTGAARTSGLAPTAAAPAAAPDGSPKAVAPAIEYSKPTAGIGQPGGRMGIQEQVTGIGQEALWMHNVVLMPIITIISLFVLGLLLWVVVRYRRAANPTPSRTSHNTLLEVFWTLAPVLLLLVIAVPSIKLLAAQYAPPKADLTVKVIGNQWYWTYQYPDNGDFELVSNMLPEADAKARGEPRLLGVDERMVVPSGAVVKLIVTSADVIHAFAVPAFWTKMDAVPGRLNETWFKVDRPGVYYGQCSELCGARHGFMPIAVDVVTPDKFAAWVASKGGTMPGPGGAANPDATSAASPATAAAPAAAAGSAVAGAGAGGSDATVNSTVTAQPVAQGATANEGTQAQ